VIVVIVVILVAVVLPEVRKVEAQVVRFQKAAQVGPGAFTPPADARARAALLQGAGGGGEGGGDEGGGGGEGAAPPRGRRLGNRFAL